MSLWAQAAAKVFNDAFGHVTESSEMSQVKRTRTGELGAGIAKWSDLLDRLDGIETSTAFDREAVDDALLSVGIDNGSLYDPIALMHALSKAKAQVTLVVSGQGNHVSLYYKGRSHTHTSGSINASIALCVAKVEMDDAIQELSNLNNSGAAKQSMQASYDAQQQWLLQQRYKNQLYGQLFTSNTAGPTHPSVYAQPGALLSDV